MIIQQNPDKPNTMVGVDQENSACLVVQAFDFLEGSSAGDSFDLTEMQGRPVRVYLDLDGSATIDATRDHYWLLAEAILPDCQFENKPTGRLDENGQEITDLVERPLDLNEVEITVFPLPEVE
jgi:hypothetical protein